MAVIRALLLAALLGVCMARKRYDGYKVLRIIPQDDTQLQAIGHIKKTLGDTVDFWTDPVQAGVPADVMVAPDTMDSVMDLLHQSQLYWSVMMDDVQHQADQVSAGQPGGIASLAYFNYDIYHTGDEIDQWVTDMAFEHQAIVQKRFLGLSYEGREQNMIVMGKPGTNKPIFWLHGGAHSREWLSPATILKMVNMFVTEYEKGNQEIVDLLDAVDFHILPMLNPDGYYYSIYYDRMWRKTRSPSPDPYYWCIGTDPNRNWDSHWGDPGSDNYPCSSTYRGASPFSEVEVNNVAYYLNGILPNVKVFIDMHCYSQLWLLPYGHTTAQPPNYSAQKNLADSAMAALYNKNGASFRVGSIAKILYSAYGNALDWAMDVGIKYAFAPELRDTGYYGFLMPEVYIDPSASEVFEAIKVTAKAIV